MRDPPLPRPPPLLPRLPLPPLHPRPGPPGARARGWATDLVAGAEDDGYVADSCRCPPPLSLLTPTTAPPPHPPPSPGGQARGWATDLVAGVEDDGYGANSCCYLFSVGVTLTRAGLDAGPGLGLAAVGLVFQYMRLLSDAGGWMWPGGGVKRGI